MTIQEIQEIVELFKDSGLGEMEVQRGENRVRLRRDGMDIVAPAAAAGPHGPTPTPTAAPAPDESALTVKSPIVGTFYESASPEAAPYVKAGDAVEPGQVLCIVEAMKLMNEIKAETAGTVIAKLVKNGQPVEYGQPLITLKP